MLQYYIDSFGEKGDAWDFFKCFEFEFPSLADAQQYDAIFITGSHYSAYDDSKTWIKDLSDRLGQYAQAGIRLAGGCFGCQILGRALGGKVGKNPSERFVLKVESIQLTEAMLNLLGQQDKAALKQWKIIESHGDQVLELPEGAELLASSNTAQCEIWNWKNQILAWQSHPEFSPGMTVEKIWTYLKADGTLTPEEAEESYTSLTTSALQSEKLNNFIKRFVRINPPKAQVVCQDVPVALSSSIVPWKNDIDNNEGSTPAAMTLLEPTSSTSSLDSVIQQLIQQAKALSLIPNKKPNPSEDEIGTRQTKQCGSKSEPFDTVSLTQKLDNTAQNVVQNLSQLLKLELEQGKHEYGRLEVVNRISGSEYQKMLDDIRKLKGLAQGFVDKGNELFEEATRAISEIDRNVTKLEVAVKQLDERTMKLQ